MASKKRAKARMAVQFGTAAGDVHTCEIIVPVLKNADGSDRLYRPVIIAELQSMGFEPVVIRLIGRNTYFVHRSLRQKRSAPCA